MPFTAHLWALVGAVGLALTIWQQSGAASVFYGSRDGSLVDLAQMPFGRISDRIERRVVAVADLHGDLQHAHNVLRMAGLIDEDPILPNWIGGSNVLVSTGDIVDRGDDTIALYEMFQRLRVQAQASGGQVLNCIGNHEMMNALVDWRYVTPGDLESFGGAKQRREMMSDQGWIGKDWLMNYSITHTVELLPSSQLSEEVSTYDVPRANFVHGGIHAEWAAKSLKHINEVGHGLLFKALSQRKPEGWLPPDTTEEEAQFYDQNGPLWYRGYATHDEEEICKEAEQAMSHLTVRHLVMGHTPHLSGFVVRCKGAVLLIDTGISKAYGGEQSALLFDTTLQPTADRTIWREESRITALYRGRMPRLLDTRTRDVHM